ncbi:hypothetical protein KEJ36_01635 [Candidatus Bathyarchaeota archaeon]|nr:hypothetical protein [Candidatus Bathyarchaeota archaeon]MBS7627517.1 hypothetical protein [Candidatus Bathyarchaeota archaeon]
MVAIGAVGLSISIACSIIWFESRSTREISKYLVKAFNERLARQESQLEVLRQDTSENTMAINKLVRREELRGARIEDLEKSVILSLEAARKVLHHTLAFEGRLRNLEVKLKEIEEGRHNPQIQEIKKELKDLASKIESYEILRQEGIRSEIKENIILEEKGVLSKLTPTELKVLKLLSSDGAKTSRQIEQVLGKTREHTARLMKKLYVEGYVERNSERLPYIYRINERVRKALESAKSPKEV